MGKKLEFAVGVLNGAVGDYLARTQNGLATEMAIFQNGESVALTHAALARAFPNASPRVVVLVHGVMCTEDVWEMKDGDDYGKALARDFGVTPVYVRYNTGLAIPDNGAALAVLLEAFASAYPVALEEIVFVAYSMGGLVVRSACHVAAMDGLSWLPRVRRAFYVATPHLGAPLERAGRVVAKILNALPDPYTRLIADIANLRSDGLKDLGDGDVRHEDRARRRGAFGLRDAEHPVPLLPSIQHYLVAGSLHDDPRLGAIFGDSLVPVPSGTFAEKLSGTRARAANAAFPPGHVNVLSGIGHLAMAHHPEVYAQLRAWFNDSTVSA